MQYDLSTIENVEKRAVYLVIFKNIIECGFVDFVPF